MPSSKSFDRDASAEVSRRGALSLLGLGGAATLLSAPSTLRALQPAATSRPAEPGMQGAGFYRLPLGDATVTMVSDGGFVMKPSEFLPDVPERELAEAMRAAHLTGDAFPGQVNCVVVQRGDACVLLDAGCGRSFGPTTGFLVQNLKRAGLAPGDVTHVVLTHAHPDHVGGLLDASGRPAFANARVYVNRAEHDFWLSEDPKMAPNSLVPPAMIATVVATARAALTGAKDQIELVRPDDTIAGLVTVVDAPGHTPGHVALRIGADGSGTDVSNTMLHFGDALHLMPLQMPHPEWRAAFDYDPVAAAVTRRMLLEEAAKDARLTTAAHATFPPAGYVDREGAAFRWTPKLWTW